MSLESWLFLYLAGLVELALRYRLSFSRGHFAAAFIVVLPLIVLALSQWQKHKLTLEPRSQRILLTIGSVVAFCCAIIFARIVSLDFWNTERLDLAWLSAGIGIGGLMAVREQSSLTKWHTANWLIVGVGWLLALWNPVGPWLAIAPATSLAVWQSTMPENESPSDKRAGLSPAWILFLIGMGMSKSWWDSDSWGALGTALWAFGVAGSYLARDCVVRMRDFKLSWPFWFLALFPFLYPWLPIWIWAPCFGVLSGWALQQSARPWHWAAAFALLGGIVLSYGLHSNLQWFGWLVWGHV